MSDDKKLYIDEPTVVSFFCGEVGWMIQRWQGYLRWLKVEKYKDHKFILMLNQQFHILVQDFVYCTIDLPKEFYSLNLETDCYEAPLPGSPPGALTPPDVYASLIEYFRHFYNVEKAIEIWPPRGCNPFWIDHQLQIFAKYTIDLPPMFLKPIMCVCPRGRSRAPNRNVPEYIWREVVDGLKREFTVVLCGTPSGSFLADYESEDVINLIKYDGDDKFEKVIEHMCNSLLIISSQSGLTHAGLMTGRPSYIIGHEKERHAIAENRLQSPVSFRHVSDYRCIDSFTILSDIADFLYNLSESGHILNASNQEEVEWTDL